MPYRCGDLPGLMEQAMFGPLFLGPSSCEVSSADPKKGCSVALEAFERVCCSVPDWPNTS